MLRLTSDEQHCSSDHTHAHTAPRVAGLLVKLLAWVLETPVLGWIVLAALKRDNLVYKVACSNLQ